MPSHSTLRRLAALALLPFGLVHCNLSSETSSARTSKSNPNQGAQLLDQVAPAATPASTPPSSCGTTVTDLANLSGPLAALNEGTAVQTPAGDTASRLAVFSALSAVPQSLLGSFFKVAGGRIVVSDGATLCKDAPLSSEERALLGAGSVTACWRAADAGQPVRLILSPDANQIRGSLLRLFAYWESEFLIVRLLDPAAPAPYNSAAWHAFTSGFTTERTRLADAFLADLANLNASNLASMQQHQNSDPSGFGNIVYANAVDSYYCSKASRQKMQDDFKNTWSVFTDASIEQSPLNQLGE